MHKLNTLRIPIKTSKAVNAIAQETHDLGCKCLTLLVMLDGQSTIEELIHAFNPLGDIPVMIDDLNKQGYVRFA